MFLALGLIDPDLRTFHRDIELAARLAAVGLAFIVLCLVVKWG